MSYTRPLAFALSLLWLTGCGDDGAGDDGGRTDGAVRDAAPGILDGSAPDGATPGMDGAVRMDGAVPDGGPVPDGSIALPDGGVCTPSPCAGTVWACGNCMDDDGDGLLDAQDPDCTGACDNNEAGYALMIPGSDTPNCTLDCYYDDDQGSGNDRCLWNSSCDPLAPEDPICPFTGPGGGVMCPDPQRAECLTNCAPITPNGCDCFGCCELPAGSGSYVFLGSRPTNGAPPCSAATATNPDSCHACTPVTACFNPCGRCEVCLGGSPEDVPCDCFEPGTAPPRCGTDAGVPPGVDAGPRLDAGPLPDGGTPPSSRCPSGGQPCGQPTDPVCPAAEYCQTGCCVTFG